MQSADILELEHSIGYNGKYQNTVHYHPVVKDQLIYNIGGLLVLENLHDKHQQEFLRGHDMEITCISISKSGKPTLSHLQAVSSSQDNSAPSSRNFPKRLSSCGTTRKKSPWLCLKEFKSV